MLLSDVMKKFVFKVKVKAKAKAKAKKCMLSNQMAIYQSLHPDRGLGLKTKIKTKDLGPRPRRRTLLSRLKPNPLLFVLEELQQSFHLSYKSYIFKKSPTDYCPIF